MSQELERVYTINLGKVLLSPDNQRAKRAINMIREFARHHMKTEEIKIEEDVAHKIWARGIKSPPRKIRVRMTRTEEGFVLVAPYEEDVEVTKPTDKAKEKLEEKATEQTEIPTDVEEQTKKETEAPAEVEEKPTKEAKATKEAKPTKKEKPKKESKPASKSTKDSKPKKKEKPKESKPKKK